MYFERYKVFRKGRPSLSISGIALGTLQTHVQIENWRDSGESELVEKTQPEDGFDAKLCWKACWLEALS